MLFLAIFQHYHIYQGWWKNVEPTFQCIVLLQSWGQSPKKNLKLLDKSVPYLWQELGHCPLDWRTTIHCNIGPAFFHRPWFIWLCLKIAKTTFQHMVVLQSRGQVSSSCWNVMKPGSQSGMEMMKCWKKIQKFNHACLLCC